MICARKNIPSLFATIVTVSLFLVALFSSSSSSSLVSAAPIKRDNMIDLTDSNFEQAVRENPLLFVAFVAPWCGHSKKLLPELNSLAEGDNSMVKFARFDASANPKIAQKYDIKHFPTLKFWRNGHTYQEYEGSRESNQIDRYIKKMREKAVMVFRNKAHFQELLDLAQFPTAMCVDKADSETCKLFDQGADQARSESTRWFAFESPEQIEEFGLTKHAGKIIVARSIHEDHVDGLPKFIELKASPTGSLQEIINEVHIISCPTFGPLNPDTYRDYMHVKLPMLYLFMNNAVEEVKKDSADRKAYEAMKSLAAEYEGKLTFVHIDASKYGSLAPRVGLHNDRFPALAIDQAGAFYNIPQDGSAITTDRIRKFADNFLAGKLPRVFRSEEAPSTNTVDGLTTVTANTFEELVTKNENDVLLVMWAPWCSHCKELMPTIGEVAKKMKDEDVTIAKMDATANEYDKKTYKVEGFPTIFYIKKGSEPEEYAGGRTKDEILDYLRKKADSE